MADAGNRQRTNSSHDRVEVDIATSRSIPAVILIATRMSFGQIGISPILVQGAVWVVLGAASSDDPETKRKPDKNRENVKQGACFGIM
jgi:hypothetical protein